MSFHHAIYYDIVSQVKRDLGLHPVDDTVFDRRNSRQFNLETEDMPIEEWEQLEADLQDKGYLKRSNLPKATKENAAHAALPVTWAEKQMYHPNTQFRQEGTQTATDRPCPHASRIG